MLAVYDPARLNPTTLPLPRSSNLRVISRRRRGEILFSLPRIMLLPDIVTRFAEIGDQPAVETNIIPMNPFPRLVTFGSQANSR